MESLAQQQALPGVCSPRLSCTQSKAAGPGHPPWEASRDGASGLLSQTPRPPFPPPHTHSPSSSGVWLLVRLSSPADQGLNELFHTLMPRYPVAATHRCHLQEREVDLSNNEMDWNELGRGFSVTGVRSRNRCLRNRGPNVPLKGTHAPQAGVGLIDLQVPARVPGSATIFKGPRRETGASGHFWERFRDLQGETGPRRRRR